MSTKERIIAEIKKKIEANKTKNGFPAGTLCAVRIEAYETLVSFINSLPDDSTPKRNEEMNTLAASAANDWCRCFKCDRIVNETGLFCTKPRGTCLKWFDAYKGAMIALEKLDAPISRSHENGAETEHTDAAIAVLTKRADCCRDIIKNRIETKRHFDVSFYAGEKQGYEQAIDLLKSSTESIRIEL